MTISAPPLFIGFFILYRALLDGQEVIFYVLLEFQSSVDNSMPARLLAYMTEVIRQSFLQADRNERMRSAYRIPAVVPIVVYTGNAKWTPPLSFRDYQNKGELFGNSIIDFTYILLDTKRFSEDELSGIGSLVSMIFMLDEGIDVKHTARKLTTVGKILQKLSEEQQTELLSWVENILLSKPGNKNVEEIKNVIQSIKRGEDVMETGLFSFMDQAKEEGIEQGIEQGEVRAIKRVLKTLVEKGYTTEEMASIALISVDEVQKLLSE
jgi:predicted transposase/invertase (TIGR01784 family)